MNKLTTTPSKETITERDTNASSDNCASCGAKPNHQHTKECTGGDHRLTYTLEYCTGQYWPTEYRAVVCAICASALWSYRRNDVPADVENKGDYIRASFKRQFGLAIARRWFN